MATKLIKLNNGILVEVSVEENEAQQIAGGLAEKVNSILEKIQPIVYSVALSMAQTWTQITETLDIVDVEKATVELGLSFETEGNLYIAKGKAAANLTITMELKPKTASTTQKPSSVAS